MLVITGMHRSGTSLVARLLHLAGADLGDPRSFYPADRWNPDGYFEQREVQAVNISLVQGIWWKLAYLRLPSRRTILERAAARRRRLERAVARFQGLAVKDARFCLTLPAWLAHGARVTGVLICLREPIDVARSLRRRNHISLGLGLSLWAAHCRRLLEDAVGLRVGFVLYSNLLSGTTATPELRRAFRFAGLDRTVAETAELCRRAARSPAHPTPQPPHYPSEVQTLWRTLLERHAAQSDADGWSKPAPLPTAP